MKPTIKKGKTAGNMKKSKASPVKVKTKKTPNNNSKPNQKTFKKPNTPNQQFQSPNQRFQQQNPSRPPFGGGPRRSTPFREGPRHNAPFGGPPRHNTPFGGPPRHNTPFGGPPRHNTPFGGPPRHNTPFGGPPRHNAPFGGPPRHNAPFGGPPPRHNAPFNGGPPSFNRSPRYNAPFNRGPPANVPFATFPRPHRPFNPHFNMNQQNSPSPQQFSPYPRQNAPPNFRNQQNRPPNFGYQQNAPPNQGYQQNAINNSFQRPFNNTNRKPKGVKRKATAPPAEPADAKKKPKVKKQIVSDPQEKNTRTVFVGNVPLDTTDKEIKKLFSQYGEIESLRFRGVPRADIRQSKKVALFKKNFHESRKSMNAYVVFAKKADAEKAVAANGKILKEHCLRVSLSTETKPKVDDKSIFVGNLPFNAEDNDLIKIFKDCGNIHSVRISRDPVNSVGRGFAYVNFKSTDGVELALQMENVNLKGRVLRIKRSNPKKVNKVEADNWMSVKIDGLPTSLTRGFLFKAFKKCGKIINITFNNSTINRRIKSAIVAFKTAEAANLAVKTKVQRKNKALYIVKDPFNPYKHVFLRGLPLSAKNVHVKAALSECGPITRCKLLLKPQKPYTTGFGIVEFETVEGAKKAIQLKTIKIKDLEDVVNIESYIKNQHNAESEDDEDSDETEEPQNGKSYESDDDDSDDEGMAQNNENDEDSDSDTDQEKDDDSEESDDDSKEEDDDSSKEEGDDSSKEEGDDSSKEDSDDSSKDSDDDSDNDDDDDEDDDDDDDDDE